MSVNDTMPDVLVVGAGAAGAVLAARLSEDPRRTVLLLEAGADALTPEDFPEDLRDASLGTGLIPGQPHNWSFMGRLTPELPYPVVRGKILGGSTAVNGSYFIRARKHDFDRWVAAGNDEWSYEKSLPYYLKLENDLTYGDTALHSSQGPIPVHRETRNPSRITQAFFAAAEELGFPEDVDKNGEGTVGYGLVPLNAVDGIRQNTALTYLLPVRDRENLTVRAGTYVRRVVFEGRRAVGVEVDGDRGVEVIRGREIVLAAGAIKSPHLLMLSGIGPAEELAAAGIPVLHDAPGVGKDFTDHPDVPFGWKPRRRLDDPDIKQFIESALHFTSEGSDVEGDLEIMPTLKPFGRLLLGRSTTQGVTAVLRRPLQTLKSLKGSSIKRLVQQALHRNDIVFTLVIEREDARGTLRIVSADPHVQPELDFHYLSTERDRARMRQMIRTAVALLRTEAFKPYVKKLTEIDENTLADNRLLDEWARTHIVTSLHTAGTARMGRPDDPGAVVDQHGRVHGVEGLRVVDMSILPDVPSRGPAATAVMIGEKVADMMKAEAPDGQMLDSSGGLPPGGGKVPSAVAAGQSSPRV